LVAFIGSAIASLVTAATAAAMLQAGASRHGVLFLHHASQFALSYRIDGLAAWFLIVLSTLAIPVAVFSIGYFAQGHVARRSAFSGAAFNVLVGAVELVFVASDVITFLFAWELMTLTAAALVTTEHEERDNRRAAFLYLVMSHVATGCLIAGFLTLASRSGSVSFSTLLSGDVVRGPMRDGLFGLFFIGFGVKAGIIPLHVWLPEAHPAAPTSISALMSGVLLKAGIYGRVRVWSRRAEIVLGRHRCGRGWVLGGARRPLCADATRSQEALGVSQYREHRDHSVGSWRGDDRSEEQTSE